MDTFEFSLTPKDNYVLGEAMPATFTIKNISDHDVALLTRNTPLDGGILDDIIKITKGRSYYRIPYDGLLLCRTDPNENSYVILKKGEHLSVEIDLAAAYHIDKVMSYKVSLDTQILDHIILDREDKMQLIGKNEVFRPMKATTPIRQFSVSRGSATTAKHTEGMELRVQHGFPAKLHHAKKALQAQMTPSLETDDPADPVLNGGDDSEQKQLKKAHTKAYKQSVDSYNKLVDVIDNDNDDSDYEKWFGVYSSSRAATARDSYKLIKDSLNTTAITYNLDAGSGCIVTSDGSVVAYTTKNSTTIWLCDPFWGLKTTGAISKYAYLIHEFMHCISSRDDIVYYKDNVLELAKDTPNDAVKNADNYRFYTPYR